MKIFLLAITLIVLAAVTATFGVGIRSFDGLVTDDPYVSGIHWDETRKAAEALGWRLEVLNPKLSTGRNLLAFSITDRSGREHAGAVTALLRTRPSTNRYDRGYPLGKMGGGPPEVEIDFPLPGRWTLEAKVDSGKGEVTLLREVFVVPRERGAAGETGAAEVRCDFAARPCTAEVGSDGMRIILEVEPVPPATMKPLRFRVRLQGDPAANEVRHVSLSLFMPGMVMGPNHPPLMRAGPAIFTGEGVLPRCISGKKLWGAEISVGGGKPEKKIRFLFEVAS